MTQTEELGPFGSAGVAAIVGGYLIDTPSALSSTPTVRWITLIGLAGIFVGGIAIGIRDL